MAAAALTFVLIAGLGLLFSTLTRFDGAVVALLYVISMALQQVASMPVPKPLPAWLTWLAGVLPPVHKLDHLRDQLYAGQPLVTGSLWHVLAYGLGAFALGLVALRRLPLSR
jgi:ABC-type polysaccharide/polyol phosphate export permease